MGSSFDARLAGLQGVAVNAMKQLSEGCLHMQWSQAMALPTRHVPSVGLEEEALPLPRTAVQRGRSEPPAADPEGEGGAG